MPRLISVGTLVLRKSAGRRQLSLSSHVARFTTGPLQVRPFVHPDKALCTEVPFGAGHIAVFSVIPSLRCAWARPVLDERVGQGLVYDDGGLPRLQVVCLSLSPPFLVVEEPRRKHGIIHSLSFIRHGGFCEQLAAALVEKALLPLWSKEHLAPQAHRAYEALCSAVLVEQEAGMNH